MSSDQVSVRKWLGEQLVELLPDEWKIHDSQETPEVIMQPTVIIKHNSMEPIQEARRAGISHELVVTLASRYQKMSLAEDELDNTVLELLHAVDELKAFAWTKAEKVQIHPERPYIGWDITINTLTKKE